MAYIGDSCLRIGDIKWYIGDSRASQPDASLYPEVLEASVNSYARIDASTSSTDDDLDTLDFLWSIDTKPIDSAHGYSSQFTILNEGKTLLLLLDKVGPYRIELTVKGANGGCSQPAYCYIMAVPYTASHSSQIAPDVSWVWQMLPSFWSYVDAVDRHRMETFWRGALQIISSDVMDGLNAQDNRSIATIQRNVVRRWYKIQTSYEPVDYQFKLKAYETFDITSKILSGDFITSVSVDNANRLSGSPDQSFSGRVLRFNEVLCGSNISKADIGSFISIESPTITNQQYTIIDVKYLDATNFSALLSSNLPIDTSDIGTDCSITVSNKPFINHIVLRSDKSSYQTSYSVKSGTLALNSAVPGIFSDITQVVSTIELISPDLENNGVCAGDIVSFSISDDVSRMSKKFSFKILSILGDVACIELPTSIDEIVIECLKTFESTSYSQDLVDDVLEYLRSEGTKRRLLFKMYNGGDSIPISISYLQKSYSIRLDKIIRTKKIPIDSDIVSIPKVTEFIERVQFIDGKVVTKNDQELYLGRPPLDLVENLSYYVQPSTIKGSALRSGTNLRIVVNPRFDFKFAGVSSGDSIYIKNAFVEGSYRIIGVAPYSLILDRELPMSFVSADYAITKPIQGSTKFLVFSNPLDFGSVIPENLWAESVLISNNDAIDMNFGSLLNLSYLDWQAWGVDTEYYDVMIGLMLARMSAASVGNIQRSTSIISGIPYAKKKSIIKDIKEDYELDSDGNPKTTLMVLEEVDENGVGKRFINTYKFPSQSAFSENFTSGIAINPSTGKRYKKLDTVEQYALLALGVHVYDLYNNVSNNKLNEVRDRHRFRVTINSDSTNTSSDALEFVNSFILSIKPSYTDYVINLLKYVVDSIKISDKISVKLKSFQFDNPYKFRNIPQIFDYIKSRYGMHDTPDLLDLLSSYPKSTRTVYQNPFTYLYTDVDLTDVHKSYRIRTDSDLVVIRDGYNAGKVYKVHSFTSEYVQIRGKVLDQNVSFGIVRPMVYELSGRTDIQSGNDLSISKFDCEVVQGDLVLIENSNYPPLEIVSTTAGVIRTKPPITTSIDSSVRLVRPQIAPPSIYKGDATYEGNKIMLQDIQNCYALGIQPGDLVIANDFVSKVVAVSVENYIHTLSAPSSDILSIEIRRELGTEFNTSSEDLVDEFQKAYNDSAIICLNSSDLSNIFNGKIQLPEDVYPYIVPGDIIRVLDSRGLPDIGEGNGVYRIIEKLPNYVCKLCYNITSSGKYSILRQAPLKRLYIDKQGLRNESIFSI